MVETKKRTNGYPVAEVIDVLKLTHGLIAMAARQLGCTRQTLYNHIDRHPTVAEALDEARAHMGDVAELALFQSILNREGWAVTFYLKTQGRKRGYVEYKEVGSPDGQPFVVSIAELQRKFDTYDDDTDPAAEVLSLPSG